jgi:antidote-toxin recognition MazE-like antitoxin
MHVAKWGNSLAVRLPAAVVEALQLKPQRITSGVERGGHPHLSARDVGEFVENLRADRAAGSDNCLGAIGLC